MQRRVLERGDGGEGEDMKMLLISTIIMNIASVYLNIKATRQLAANRKIIQDMNEKTKARIAELERRKRERQ